LKGGDFHELGVRPKVQLSLNLNRQSKRWCFTVDYDSNEDIIRFHHAADRAYVIIGREVGENGAPHLQGYITFFKPKRLSACKHIHPTAHWEIARGSTEQNIAFFSKGGAFHELGNRPKFGQCAIDSVDVSVAGESITEAPVSAGLVLYSRVISF
jgi:hypothetical protein